MDAYQAYLGLFVTSLIAGTFLPFLPGSSEMAMAGLMAARAGFPPALLAVAVGANVLGATVNYLVGRNVAGLADRRWFPLPRRTLDRASAWFDRYGVWALALCWLPTFGDAITVIAGLLRADFRLFLPLVCAGKLFGHGAVALGLTWIIER
ncbi:YqaA family protein [Methylobacterium oxalidis]|uniref:Membrane protein n=1 Tax=Methylobacterium oxalidis TaxID=944322 RepID=A0A512J5T6_9HYPH|nr:VTT domain-containing protein [Methylobacterium oxalidis]GEP05293.1 membrane protein [Methylobacterium oxalidis]GJE29993.1 Inner membrane protein YqaA [Methylobacterium oxalidis]GLS64663.1 membrane protein [Methylobacterium oxalidis]